MNRDVLNTVLACLAVALSLVAILVGEVRERGRAQRERQRSERIAAQAKADADRQQQMLAWDLGAATAAVTQGIYSSTHQERAIVALQQAEWILRQYGSQLVVTAVDLPQPGSVKAKLLLDTLDEEAKRLLSRPSWYVFSAGRSSTLLKWKLVAGDKMAPEFPTKSLLREFVSATGFFYVKSGLDLKDLTPKKVDANVYRIGATLKWQMRGA